MLNSHAETNNETFPPDLVDFSMKSAYFRGFRRATQKSLKGRRLPMAGIHHEVASRLTTAEILNIS
jgi:hypothetical protein